MILQRSFSYLKTISLFIALVVFLTPFLIMIMNTFKSTMQFAINPFSLPESIHFDNYVNAFQRMNFAHSFLNSFIITVSSIILIILFASMTGYLFVRFKWKLNKILFFTIVSSMALPFQVIMIPLVFIYGNLDLLNTRQILVFIYIGFTIPLGIFTFHGFIKGIAYELEESAFIEGSSRLRTFFQIVLPLLKPIMVTLIILNVLFIWNDYLLPSLVLLSPSLKTLPLTVFTFFAQYSVDYGPLMAGLVMTIIPVFVLYLLLQKLIIQGITEGALK